MSSFFAILAVLLVASPQDAAPSRFPLFVRLDEPLTAESKQALLAAGISGFVVGAADAATLASIGDAPRILEDVLDRGDFAFTAASFESSLDDYLVTRDPQIQVRKYCPRREPFRGELLSRIRSLSAVSTPRPLAVSLARDPSWTLGSAPHDLCYCTACVDAWRSSLAKRFENAAAAAAALGLQGAPFAELDEITDFEPWSVDRVRAWNEDLPRERVQLGPWLDYRESLDDGFADTLSEFARAATGVTGAPTGFVGGALTNPFGGHDWARLASSVDVLMPPDDPTSRDVALAHGARFVLGWLRTAPRIQRFARRLLADSLFAGVDAGFVEAPQRWMEIDPQTNGFRPTELATVATPVLRWLRGAEGEAWRAASLQRPAVRVLYSPRSLKIHWLIDAEPAGIYWPSLAANLDGEVLPLVRTWWGWQWLLQDLQVQYSWLDEDGLESDVDALDGVAVLVLPRTISLSVKAEQIVRAYIERGGRVWVDGECALFDEFGNGSQVGRLDDLGGVVREDPESPWDQERPGFGAVQRGERDSLRDLEALARVESPSHPRVVWLDLYVGDYVDVVVADSGSHGEELRARLRASLDSAGVSGEPRIRRADGIEPARVHLRVARSADATLVAVLRTDVLPELVGDAKDETDAPIEYVLELAAPCVVEDLSFVKSTTLDGAPTTSVRFTLPIEGSALFRFRPQN